MTTLTSSPAATIIASTPKGATSRRDPSTGTDQVVHDTHSRRVGSGPSSAPAATIDAATAKRGSSRRDADLLLYLYADQLDDIEDLRTATANRLRSLLSDDDWGKGVNPDLPEVRVIQDQLDQIEAVEHSIELALKRAMRAHYLGDWCKNAKGVGEKQLARLLAAIGDPGAREKPSQLWAYCGLHVIRQRISDTQAQCADDGHPGHEVSDDHFLAAGVAPTRTRGQKANWSTEAKTRVYLIAESAVKAGVRKLPHCDDRDGYDIDGRKAITPYGEKYLFGRLKYADAIHAVECKRCGPKGKPAQPGSPLSDGHKHARAMRLVMKRILLDLWKESRGGGEASFEPTPTGTSPAPAGEQQAM